MRFYHGTDAQSAARIAEAGRLDVTTPTGHRAYVTDDHAVALYYALRAVSLRRHTDPQAEARGVVLRLDAEPGHDVERAARDADRVEYVLLRALPIVRAVTVDLSAQPAAHNPRIQAVADRSAQWARRNTCAWCGRLLPAGTTGTCSTRCAGHLAAALETRPQEA